MSPVVALLTFVANQDLLYFGDLSALAGPRKAILLAIFARMPYAQNVNGVVLDFVAHFVAADKHATHLARIEFLQALADARIDAQARRRGGQ